MKFQQILRGYVRSRTYFAFYVIVFIFLFHLSVMCMCANSLQMCPTLCLPGSSLHRILQARVLEWVAMPSSRGSSRPRDQTRVSYVSCISRQVLYHRHNLGSPHLGVIVHLINLFPNFSCTSRHTTKP